MDKSHHEEATLLLTCKKCYQNFYWGSVYLGVSCLTRCPCCKYTGSDFVIKKKIYNGTTA